MTTLIISEKPSAMKKIAEALADKTPQRKTYMRKVGYYELKHEGKDVVVVSAVGHLYTVAEKDKKGWTYPVFGVEWKPSHEVSKGSAFTKPYLGLIKKMAKGAKEVIVACDYDVEGEVIGYNVVRYACGKKDAKRMKFSTTTKEDLRKSYENMMKHMDHGQIEAGVTRHELDWLFGINLSRALTLSVKNATGMFKVLSSGRVQGPALKILSEREKEIKAFVPVPYWELELQCKELNALHEKGKFDDKKEVDKVYKKCKGKPAVVSDLKKKQFKQAPPNPFDLTALQVEAYRTLRIQPKKALEIAQSLYTNSFISYPRTSSNQLPASIGYKKILTLLQKQGSYKSLCVDLLKKALKPNNGKKKDPAHPAIFPTGEVPRGLDGQEKKLYDLIVRRFMSTFGEAAVRETVNVEVDVEKEKFLTKGTRTVEENWHKFYKPYLRLEEEEVNVKKGQQLNVKDLVVHDKETQPPKRFTPSSIIKELEKRNLGTKCLHGDTLVVVKLDDEVCYVSLRDLYDCGKLVAKQDSADIVLNSSFSCFVVKDSRRLASLFPLVSKRMLEKEERMYRVKFMDGSYIDATENHPFLMRGRSVNHYVPVKRLSKGDRSVCSVNHYGKVGKEVFSWEDFLAAKPSAIFGFCSNLKEYRGELSQAVLAGQMGHTQCFVQKSEKKEFVSLEFWNRFSLPFPDLLASRNCYTVVNPFPLRMTSALARLLANFVGDGSIDREKLKKENCYDFRYHNTDLVLIKGFIQDLKFVFGERLKVRIAKGKEGHKEKYYVQLPALIGRLFGVISPELLTKNASPLIYEKFYPEFIAALFDDEGHVCKDEPKLFICNTNHDLLIDVKGKLESLGIRSVLDRGQHKLHVRGRFNLGIFLEKIPFRSLDKRKRLVSIFSRFYRANGSESMFFREKRILSFLADGQKTSKEIVNGLDLPLSKVRGRLKSLRKRGYIKKVVVGISEYPRKKIYYCSLVDVSKTFYAQIGEEVIDSNFYTKTIESVSLLPREECEVYDITNIQEMPNFVVGNGVVVHNSTRSDIIEHLFDRSYLKRGHSIEVTDLGLKTIEVLDKFCPDILDEKLTREFEDDMAKIREGKSSQEKIINWAEKFLTKVLKQFKGKEKEIGQALSGSYRDTMKEESFVMVCDKCGKDLQIKYTPKFKSYFIACSGYPNCTKSFSLPRGYLAKSTNKKCKACEFPEVLLIKKGKRPWSFCINPVCPKKEEYNKKFRQKK